MTSPVRVHMTGSAWFSTVPGGLNRYFTDLYRALGSRPDLEVSAAAFGEPVGEGQSWGPPTGSTWRRVRAAFAERTPLPGRAILDRHFCLYGRPAIDRRGRHPLVVHFHGPWAAESRMAGSGITTVQVKYWMERIRYLGADRYVVLSHHFRDLLAETYHVPRHRIRVIPPGVDLDRFRPPDRPRPSRTVLCVRRLERRMGIDVLIHAWPEVLAAHRDAQLVIVGTGREEPALRARVAASGLGESVSLEGRAEDERLVQLYERAALTVVPSVELEGFGLIALESLAAGRAPIVTDCGGLPEAVCGLDPSLIVPSRDARALANRIVRALDGDIPGPGRCRAHAESFSWHAAAERHTAMYREMLA